MPWTALAVVVVLVVVLGIVALLRRRRPRVTPPVTAPTPVFDRTLRPESLAAWLHPQTRLPDGWEDRVAEAIAAAPPETVGLLVWNRTAARLGLGELAIEQPVEFEPDDGGYVEPPTPTKAKMRGSLRVRRRLAGMSEPVEPLEGETVPQHKPWSVRGGYADVDWRALDLPEPIPDDFVR